MPHLPPYVEAVDYIRVRARVCGQLVDGVVLGWAWGAGVPHLEV